MILPCYHYHACSNDAAKHYQLTVKLAQKKKARRRGGCAPKKAPLHQCAAADMFSDDVQQQIKPPCGARQRRKVGRGGDVSNKIVTAAPPPDHTKGRSPAQKSDHLSMVGCSDNVSKPSMSPEDAVKAMNDGFC